MIAGVEAALSQGSAARVASEIVGLSQIYEPEIQLVWAPVEPSDGALRYARRLAEAGLLRANVEVDTPDGSPGAGALDRLLESGDATGDDAGAWLGHLAALTEVFASLLGARCVGVRLVVSDGPHCPRFHVDRVVARGVATVLGAGTEWLEEEALDRTRLGHAGGPDDGTSGVVRDWGRIRRAEPGWLGVFKGTAWPGAEERAVVHRSPPAGAGRRVVVTLDWLE